MFRHDFTKKEGLIPWMENLEGPKA